VECCIFIEVALVRVGDVIKQFIDSSVKVSLVKLIKKHR